MGAGNEYEELLSSRRQLADSASAWRSTSRLKGLTSSGLFRTMKRSLSTQREIEIDCRLAAMLRLDGSARPRRSRLSRPISRQRCRNTSRDRRFRVPLVNNAGVRRSRDDRRPARVAVSMSSECTFKGPVFPHATVAAVDRRADASSTFRRPRAVHISGMAAIRSRTRSRLRCSHAYLAKELGSRGITATSFLPGRRSRRISAVAAS